MLLRARQVNALSLAWLFMAGLALAVRLLIPAGYMPGVNAAGPGLVICTGQGALLINEDSSHAPPSHQDGDGSASHDCPFAAGGQALAAPLAEVIRVSAVEHQVLAETPAQNQRPGLGLAAPPPPTTGPPSAPNA